MSIDDAHVLSCSLQQYIDEQNQEFETVCANFEVGLPQYRCRLYCRSCMVFSVSVMTAFVTKRVLQLTRQSYNS